MDFKHISVLLEETLRELKIKPDGIYVDGTLGGGGHSYHIAKELVEQGRLYGIDQDGDAIEAAIKRLAPYAERTIVIRDNYCNMKSVLGERGVGQVNGIVLDLGVSSYQLDEIERGFSYKYDTVLDMRMDQRQSFSAKEIINTYSQGELARMIRQYGEDQFANNIAKHIVRTREVGEITTTGQLNEIIKGAIPAKVREGNGHPSKRTFQAIRIECNHELEVLKHSIEEMVSLLAEGGRLCIITFHSLEDRIVKTQFRNMANPCTCPSNFPICVCGKLPVGKVITRKPISPSEEERKMNKRSQSAKLRVFEKGVAKGV
ncbi:MAG: 16S rRNA (cytosine(1402)-N(4))-methyltransferase RsmH [Eubacteriales bacterium]